MAGLSVVPGPEPDFYKITTQTNALTSALPTYIGISPELLPNNDTYIRYVYFLQNTSQSMLGDLTKLLKTFMVTPKNAKLSAFADLTALIFTEKSANIKAIMKIVQQLDKATSPEILRIIPLKHTSAQEVMTLYNALAKADDPNKRPFPGQKKEPTLFYFPEDAKIVAENRTNTLIVLGPKKAVDRIEEFVKVHVDKQLPPPDQMLQVFPVQHANASQIAKILNEVTKFAPGSPAQQYGSIVEGQKYLKNMIFTSDESTNSVIARASKEDWRYIKPIIEKLDTMQPQVAIEVLIVTVTSTESKQLGIQFRNKDNQLLGKNLEFQTSGLTATSSSKAPIIDTTTGSLMANLISLATGQQPGSTLLTFGRAGDIWGILKILETHTQANVISSPYLLTTNKYQASVSLGQTRQVITGTVVSGSDTSVNTKGDLPANLEVKITPQINQDNIITLDININIEEFTSPDLDNTQRIKRNVITTATLLDKEVLALGGLIQKKVNNTQSNVPALGKIPIIGWFFKNRSKKQEHENLLIFISPQIIKPTDPLAKVYTDNKADYARSVIEEMTDSADKRDPIHRWFFNDNKLTDSEKAVNEFMNKENIGMTEPEKVSWFSVDQATPIENNTIQKNNSDKLRPATPIAQKEHKRSLISFMREPS
jgi:general secretion pathway protein D